MPAARPARAYISEQAARGPPGGLATQRRGREKLHFLNPVPLQEIYERWIAKFEKPRLKALAELKQRLERTDG